MILFTLMLPFLLVPLVGLAIDATMLFSVKAKLQTAVDGAAIAAAQSLSSGLTFAVQKARAEKTAEQFINANVFRGGAGVGGYWGARDLNASTCDEHGQPVAGGSQSCIVAAEDNENKRRTVTISASVHVPLLFMRVLGFSTGTVTATGTAARRDVVLVLALDRSYSMDNWIGGVNVADAMKEGAEYFVTQFQSGRDRLGLVVFSGSAFVAYPREDWSRALAADGESLTGAIGPDTHFQDADSAAFPNMVTSIRKIAVGGYTGTAEALTLAYLELKAANQPGALNAIVLFTDGHPNGIAANFNNTLTSAVKDTTPKSTCVYKPTDLGNPAHSMLGYIGQGSGFKTGVDGVAGIFQLTQTPGKSINYWLLHPDQDLIPNDLASDPGSGCYFGNSQKLSKDIRLPSVDRYGNRTLGIDDAYYHMSDYQMAQIWKDTDKCNRPPGRQPLALANSNDSCQLGLAAWNTADMAGRRIRADATLKPLIYSMGFFGNEGGMDAVLLQRLSNINVAANTAYNRNQGQGLFLKIDKPEDITPAFQYVLSEILRLAF